MRLTVVHILYSGLGGQGSDFFSVVKADKQKTVATYAIFCGIEEVNPDYIEMCGRYGVAYSAFRKEPGPDLSPYFRIYSVLQKIKPAVIVLHGSSFVFPAWLYRLTNRQVRIIVRETQAHHLKTKRDWQWLKWSIRIANKLIFLTKESLDGVVKKFPQLPVQSKSIIIASGIDTELFSPAIKKKNGRTIILGMQSRLQKIKDHPTLLKSFRLLRDKYKSHKLRLQIAGDGNTMPALRQLVYELGIAGDVDFVGMLAETELIHFMNNLDIYIHATYGETLSNSIMQAMSCGLPIVASDVWGVNNMLDEGKTAMLVTVEDVDGMTAAISRLIEDQELSDQLGKNARNMAVSKYSLGRLFEQYVQVYEGS
jgi:glycosyltransferase involved in cell wall biosynthesis